MNAWTAGWRRRRSFRHWLPMVVIATLSLTLVSTVGPATAKTIPAGSSDASQPQVAGTSSATVSGGRGLQARLSSRPRQYTKAQLKQLNRLETENVNKGHLARNTAAHAFGRATISPNSTAQRTSILRDRALPGTGASFVQEPSTDANGRNVFQTGNWFAARSTNGGTSWNYLDPYAMFGPGFCCDQVTQFDRATGRQFWLLQFDNHLVLANASASGASPYTRWCYYNITPAWFGLPAATELDYNDLTITNNFVNISTNYFGATNGSALMRLPKAAMSHCGGFRFNRLTRSDSFTFKLVAGSTDTLYFGSNWGQSNGSSFRVYAWPENRNSYTWVNRTVASYSFFTRNSGQNCASRDGVVNNWCQFADSRTLGGYRSLGVLGFSFNAKQDNAHPFPYTRVVRFRESNRAYLGSGDLWGSWGAIQFASFAPNAFGRIGGVFAWGGGTGRTHFYPGAATYSTAPTAIATDPNYFLRGAGNTCTYGDLYRWGDYLTVRKFKANPRQWIGAAYAMKGGDCGSSTGFSESHNVLFR